MIECNIIINDTNAKKINDLLDGIQFRKRERCIYSSLSIKMIIHKVEKDILNGIPKSKWEHFTFRYIEGAQDFPKKFKFQPTATTIVIRYQKRQWRLLEIDRVECNHKRPFEFLITPKSLCDSIIEKHFENINE